MVDVTFATSEALMGLRVLWFSSKMRCSMVGAAGCDPGGPLPLDRSPLLLQGGSRHRGERFLLGRRRGGGGDCVRWSPQLGAEGRVRRVGLALGLEGPKAGWAQAGAVLRAFWLSASVPVLPVLARLRKGFGKTTAMPMGWLGKRAGMQQQRLQNPSISSGRGTGGAIRGLAGGKAGGPGGCGVARLFLR